MMEFNSLPTSTDNQTTTMAAIAGSLVGNTYELVEHALMHTEPRTVLLARRVSTTWQAIIQKSKPVQQALFFSPLRVADGKLTVEELYNSKPLPPL